MTDIALMEAAFRYALRSQSRLVATARSIRLCEGGPMDPVPVDPRLVAQFRDPRIASISKWIGDLTFNEPDVLIGVFADEFVARSRSARVTIWFQFGLRQGRKFGWARLGFHLTHSGWKAIGQNAAWQTDWDRLLYNRIATLGCDLPEAVFDLCWPTPQEVLSLGGYAPEICRSIFVSKTIMSRVPLALPRGYEVNPRINPISFSPSGKRLTLIIRRTDGEQSETLYRIFVDLSKNLTDFLQFDYPTSRACWLDDNRICQLIESVSEPYLEIYSARERAVTARIPIKGKVIPGHLSCPPRQPNLVIDDFLHRIRQTITLPMGRSLEKGNAVAGSPEDMRGEAPRYAYYDYGRPSPTGNGFIDVYEPSVCVPFLRVFSLWITGRKNTGAREAIQVAMPRDPSEQPPLPFEWSPDGRRVGFAYNGNFWILNQNFG